MMSLFAALLHGVYRISGAKKAFALPEEKLLREVEKQNRHRGFFMPTDHKAYYEKRVINGFPCLIVREKPEPAPRAILCFFGGGMVIGPDKGAAAVLRKLCYETGCDVWFPCYPLCTEHCITESYDMVFECYQQMTELYGGGNVSTCGFSSGAALALGIASHNNALGQPLPQPRHIVAVSPGEVPWNDEERARMRALNNSDVSVDYAGLETLGKIMWCDDDAIKPYFIAAAKALTLGNLRRQLMDSLEDKPFPPLPEELQRHTFFEFGSAEDHYKYRAAVMAAYPKGNFPVFEGYNHMQYQIRDPRGFAEMLVAVMEQDTLPVLPFFESE